MYILFNVNILEKDTHDLCRNIVSQLVLPECVDKLKKEFIEYVKTKGYFIIDGMDENMDSILLYSNNDKYAMLIDTYSNLDVKSDTVIDSITKDWLSSEFYNGDSDSQIYY